ncbi:MAG: hypothetical protein LBV27_05765 [Oscillospiraceae bacterium]|nr:hypothetical protein [Oscillospiraceae bacterium]
MLLPFRGSEIWGIELDSLSVYTDIVEDKFLRDMAYARRPSTTSIIAVHLTDTLVTDALTDLMVSSLCGAVPNVRKVAFIGLDKKTGKKMRLILEEKRCGFRFDFFSDYEKAKQWLVP